MATFSELIKRTFSKKETVKTKNIMSDEEENYDISRDISLREYGVFTVIDYIATLMQQAQWHTYKNGKRFKGAEWYALNVRPNANQSAVDFWYEAVSKMLLFGDALVFETKNERFLADNPISINEGNGVDQWQFENVGKLTYRKAAPLLSSEVLYFKYTNQRARRAISSLCDMYSKLANAASEEYQKSCGNKGILNIDAHQTGSDEERAANMKRLQENFKTFCTSKNALLPLSKGFAYSDLSQGSTGKEISDITALRTDALKMACEAYHMPYSLISGDVAGTSEAWSLSTATVLNPIRAILENEINGTLYGESCVLRGNYCKCDISHIKPVDIFENAERIDKLISSGFETINEVREAAGIDLSTDKMANRHFITKNYAEMKEGDST